MTTEAPLTATLKAGPGFEAPWLVVRADTPAQLIERLEGVVTAGVDGAVAVAAQALGASWGPQPAAPTTPVQAVAAGLGGQVVGQGPTSPAPSAPAPQAQGVPAGGVTVEHDKWGGVYTLNHPTAPQTPYGPAVHLSATSQAGKPYQRWIDPRSKKVPSNYQAGVRQDPADLWSGDFAKPLVG